ncbi:MAG: NAD(P)/FAD-dependent oxidoreductase [Woeseiaceae bacterium]|nr:NAD(P)/FAD-dependent oxidoreductase [Woeseiaceae bacterium]
MKNSTTIDRRRFLSGGLGAATCALLPSVVRATDSYDVVVVGAGLSGLHAAMILEEQGLNVLTLEGRNRIGGRVYTLMDVPGKPEAAGELMGANYARMIRAANDLNVELVEPTPLAAASGRYYHIRGQSILAEEWPDHELNPMQGDDRQILPNRMLFTLSHRNNPLSGRPLDDWIKPEFAKYDIPQDQYLKKYLGFNEETIRLMNVVVHTESMRRTSALHECRRYAVGEFNRRVAESQPDKPRALQVKGGNSLLPLAMANSLNNGVRLNKTVVAFDDDGSAVDVHCGDGSRYRAKQVICSMPYPVMKSVKFSPLLPDRMANAVHEIDYGISIQVHFLIKRNFWEDDGLPSSIWSDTPFERFAVLGRGENGAPSSAIAFINGDQAFRFNFMTDKQVADYTLRELARIRPSTAGALEPIVVQSCHRDVHGAGDWVYWRPGQVTDYAPYMRESHGRIHFCGEHTALMERGMEGAFESGERAALDALLNS